MLYLLAIIAPPFAVLFCGKWFQAILNIPLTLLFWVPGVIHAWGVASNHYADKRQRRLINSLGRFEQ